MDIPADRDAAVTISLGAQQGGGDDPAEQRLAAPAAGCWLCARGSPAPAYPARTGFLRKRSTYRPL